MTGEQIVLLVLGFGLGMGLMAIVHEACRWDGERRRLKADLAAAAAAAPEGGAAAPRGRHPKGH